MPLSLGEIARALGGEIAGDADIRIEKVGTLEGADAQAVTFLTHDRFLSGLRQTRAGAVILAPKHRDATALPRIICANPYAYFARVSALLHPALAAPAGVHARAVVDASAVLGEGVSIGPNAVIGCNARIGANTIVGANCTVGDDVTIGAGTRLWPGVTVYHGCRIGARGILHAGVVIGADGFGNAWEAAEDHPGGHWLKVPQVGRVVIGDDVEIGANTTIDRGAIDDTVIEDGVRLDNLIMIAHNVHVGAHTAMAACTGIAGSTRIGRYCRIGGAVGIAGHLTIADNVEISGKTLITKSITAAGTYSGGYPFEESRAWRRNAIQIRHLDELVKHVKQLEKRLAHLEGEDGGDTDTERKEP
jgi:UDP-3-O-[3-hydroxymyristoyl] glucosamine N-acyltransferase